MNWQDIKLIIEIEGAIYKEAGGEPAEVIKSYPTEDAFFGEILKRYKEAKG